MKNLQKNVLIIIILIIIVGLGAYFIYKNQPVAENTRPNIEYVYALNDFPDLNVNEDDQEYIQSLVDRLNKNYELLRNNEASSEYDAWIIIGNLKQGFLDFEGALEAWQYATTLNDVSPLAYANIANYYKSFAQDREKAEEYYKIVVTKDNIGYFFDYLSYAEMYIYEPHQDFYKAEAILLEGAGKAEGAPDRQVRYYRYLYGIWIEAGNQNKTDFYEQKILDLYPNYNFDN